MSKWLSILSYLISIITTVILLNSCNTNKLNEDRKVFRYNEYRNVTSLDPAFAKDLRTIWVTNQLFNGLVQMDASMEVIPAISKSWEISEDGKSYVFSLREDVYFHPHKLFGSDKTRLVNAHDFVYSFDRLKSVQLASPGSWILQNIDSYTAIDTNHFQINLKKPFPAIIQPKPV